eukprot:7596_1
MHSVNCFNCNKPLKTVKWCWSCKKVAYCNRKCQKNSWKQHKRQCTYNYIQINKRKRGVGHKSNPNTERCNSSDQPFNAVATSIFSRNKFIHYLTQCNTSLLTDIGAIIYTILTGYRNTFDTTDIFPSQSVHIHIPKKIEMFFDRGACPVVSLRNATYCGDFDLLLEQLKSDSKTNCKECTHCLLKLASIINGITECVLTKPYNEKLMEDKVSKFLFLSIPKHIKPNWKKFKYGIQFVRDISDDSISVLLQVLDEKSSRPDMDPDEFIREYQHSLGSFRASDVMPYLNGYHYAYLLKAVLDQYQFGIEEYDLIEYIGFSWSITNNVDLKRKFLKTVHCLFHNSIAPTSDFFFCPEMLM